MPPTSSQRRFPRVPYSAPGELELPVEHRSLPVRLREVSPGGMGLTLGLHERLRPHTRVTIRFRVADEDLALPGEVVWSDASDSLGVRLQLEVAPQRHRRTFARWVVDLLSDGPPRAC